MTAERASLVSGKEQSGDGRGHQNDLLEHATDGEFRSPIAAISKIAPVSAIRQTMRR
jgi:hypothetical protein